MPAMASPYDADPAVGAHVLPRAKDLLRSHAGQDEHDPQLVLQARVDRRAPDDSRVRRNATLDDFGDLLGLGDAHVVPARDVHEGSGRGADVDVDQGRIDRLFDRLFRAVVTIGFAQADHRDPAALHDRLDVVEVQVNEAGLRDDFRDSFDRPHQHIVRDLERRIQRQTRDEFKEFVIRDHDDRVREVAEFLEAILGVLGSDRGLRPEDADFAEPVDRVAAAPSNADDLDVRPQAGEDPLEFGVLRADAHRLRGGFREPRLNARTTHDFPDNGIHFSASGCPRKRMKQPRHSRKGGRLINVSGFAPSSSPPVDRHGAIQRMTSTPTRAFSSEGSRRPTICFDLAPVATSMTRNVCSSDASTVAPQMIRAVGETFDWTTSATRSASEIVMSFPPVTLIRTPWAVDTSTSRSGELIASSIASTARLSPTALLSPRPIIATPPPFMIVLTSLKSRLTRPGFVMISVSPLIDRMSTSSANLNARFND